VDDDDGLIYSGEGGYIHGCTEHMGTDRTTKEVDNETYCGYSIINVIRVATLALCRLLNDPQKPDKIDLQPRP